MVLPAAAAGQDRVAIGHRGGGKLSAELIENVVLPAFGTSAEAELHDKRAARL